MKHPGRRRFLVAAAAAAVAGQARLAPAQLVTHEMEPIILGLTGGARPNEGRVSVDIPRLADNGHAVPMKISVTSPMTERDYVRSIHILSERNPRPIVAGFQLNPLCGRAEIVTRVRLNGSQRVTVLAGLSDGTWWTGSAEVEVTETACLDAT